VYDIKQTGGRKFQALDLLLTGRTRHWKTMERAAKALGIEVAYVKFGLPATGRSLGKRIEVQPGLSSMERTATLAHELGHELLHQTENQRQATMKRPGRRLTEAEMETEAEATAYVIMSVLGLPSKAPSYIPWQGGTGLTVLRAMTRVQRAVKTILEAARAG
ncbi:MAG: ImmA/IrrE family metallo-endopeptidase, partial [Deltaproteobacteria bacterium]